MEMMKMLCEASASTESFVSLFIRVYFGRFRSGSDDPVCREIPRTRLNRSLSESETKMRLAP